MPPARNTREIVHASCAAIRSSAVLILGASRSGKSALTLELLSRGAVLVSDDRTILSAGDHGVVATSPKAIRGQIEARGVGVLSADTAASALVRLVVDLDRQEQERLPLSREIDLLGCRIPLLYRPDTAHFPAAILQLLKGGRIA